MAYKRMAFCLFILMALLFSALAEEDEPAARLVALDGVLYRVSDGEAGVAEAWIASFDPTAREIIIHGAVDGAQVFAGQLDISGAISAETIVIEEGVEALYFLYCEGLDQLKTIDIHCETYFVSNDCSDEKAYLIDCPQLTSFTVHTPTQTTGVCDIIEVSVIHCPDFSSLVICEPYTACVVTISAGYGALSLPKSMKWVKALGIKDIHIDPENPFLEWTDNVLLDKVNRKLLYYPEWKTDAYYQIPEGIVEAEISSPYVQRITLPKSLKELTLYCDALTSAGDDTLDAEAFRLDIPEGMEKVWLSIPRIRHLSIPSTLATIWVYDNAFETIACSGRNPYMTAIDNILYNQDATELKLYPGGNRAVEFAIPKGVNGYRIESEYLERLIMPEGMRYPRVSSLHARNLKSLALPSTLKRFPISHHDYAPHLQRVTVASSNPSMKSVDGCVYSADGETLLYVPPVKETLVIAEGTKRVEIAKLQLYVFIGSENTQTIFIPASMTEFDPSDFYRLIPGEDASMHPRKAYRVAEGHPTMMVKDGMLLSKDGKTLIAAPFIGEEYFEIPVGIEHIGRYAFPPNDALKVIAVPEGVRTIASRAFAGQLSLRRISLPSTLESIGTAAFEDCPGLEKIVLPKAMKSLAYIIPFSTDFESEWEWSLKPEITRIEMVIPPGMTEFDERYGMYGYGGIWKEDYFNVRRNEDYLWVVENNSPAYEYALKNSLPFRCID